MQDDSVHHAPYKRENNRGPNCRVLPIRDNYAYWFCFTWQNRKYIEIKDDNKIKREKNLDRLGPRPIMNICHFLGPPSFLLQTTFKG